MKGYEENDIPLDTMWSDIDYMQFYRDFTYDKERFQDLPQFIEELHNKSLQYVPILDAGIAIRKNEYNAYDSGIKEDIFVKLNGDVLVSKVWPKEATFPDFFNPKTS